MVTIYTDDNRANLIVMCGLQCSGKSTDAKHIKDLFDEKYPDRHCVILSSDQIRIDHPEIADDNSKVFSKLHSDMNYWLKFKDNVIIDATNITMKSRRQLLESIKYDCVKTCVIVNTIYRTCLSRLRKRNKSDYPIKIPEYILLKYREKFEIPFYEEGWDQIVLSNKIRFSRSNKYWRNITEKATTFDQNNLHHTQLLQKHEITVSNKIYELALAENIHKYKAALLSYSGAFHDTGKLFTQSYKLNDPNAHYYNHANVGAYELLCHSGIFYRDTNTPAWYRDDKDTLEWLFYINYHMILQNNLSDKSKAKYKKIFGDEKYHILGLFKQADNYRPKEK